VTPHPWLLVAFLTQAQKPQMSLSNDCRLYSLHKENLFMRTAGYLGRLLCSMVVLVTLLSIFLGAFSPNAIAHAASAKKGWNIAELFGARPLWKYAQKISLASVGQGQIPPCLTSAVPPRCFSPQQIRRAYNIQQLLK